MMQHLLPLAAILLLSIIPAETKVVASVADCNMFFLQETPPHIPGILEGGIIQDWTRYKWICQTLHDTRTFVTLYDTKNKIPVFSAANYIGDDGGRRPRTDGMIEPQLEHMEDTPNMRKLNVQIHYKHQAGFQDYQNNWFLDKGHLFPSSYASTDIGKRSTFTLINIVPQNKYFNSGSWNRMENCVKCILDKYCKDIGFVIIGAGPSGNSLNRKINIPSVLWSAFCCYSEKQGRWLASAHWGENVDDRPKNLKTWTLDNLKTTLRIEPFPQRACPRHTTVTHLYSDLSPNCNCSPTSSAFAPFTNTSTPSVSSSVKVSLGKRPKPKGKRFLSNSQIKITEFVKNEKLNSVRDVKVKLIRVFEQLKPNA